MLLLGNCCVHIHQWCMRPVCHPCDSSQMQICPFDMCIPAYVSAPPTHHDAQEVPDLSAGHVGQGVVLDQGAGAAIHTLEHGVNLHHGHSHAGAGGLVLALAGDPGLQGLQLGAQGLDLQSRSCRAVRCLSASVSVSVGPDMACMCGSRLLPLNRSGLLQADAGLSKAANNLA